MDNRTLEQISNHLEFLGYTVEKSEPKKEGGKTVFFGTHPTRNNLFYFDLAPNFIIFQIGLNCKKNHSVDMDSYINKINATLNVTRAFISPIEEGAKVEFEAIYMGEYSKGLFAQFYDFLEYDQRQFQSLESFDAIFL